MRKVIIESPYAGEIEANVSYARTCLAHSLSMGEAPLAGHLLYTQVLDDNNPKERRKGLMAHITWIVQADALIIYTDRGISRGMKEAINFAYDQKVPIELRSLGHK